MVINLFIKQATSTYREVTSGKNQLKIGMKNYPGPLGCEDARILRFANGKEEGNDSDAHLAFSQYQGCGSGVYGLGPLVKKLAQDQVVYKVEKLVIILQKILRKDKDFVCVFTDSKGDTEILGYVNLPALSSEKIGGVEEFTIGSILRVENVSLFYSSVENVASVTSMSDTLTAPYLNIIERNVESFISSSKFADNANSSIEVPDTFDKPLSPMQENSPKWNGFTQELPAMVGESEHADMIESQSTKVHHECEKSLNQNESSFPKTNLSIRNACQDTTRIAQQSSTLQFNKETLLKRQAVREEQQTWPWPSVSHVGEMDGIDVLSGTIADLDEDW